MHAQAYIQKGIAKTALHITVQQTRNLRLANASVTTLRIHSDSVGAKLSSGLLKVAEIIHERLNTFDGHRVIDGCAHTADRLVAFQL